MFHESEPFEVRGRVRKRVPPSIEKSEIALVYFPLITTSRSQIENLIPRRARAFQLNSVFSECKGL